MMNMRRFKHILVRSLILPSALLCASCGDFLDVSPDLGLTEDEVFGTYKNFKMYFDNVFGAPDKIDIRSAYPLYFDGHERRWAFVTSTDAADCGRYITVQQQVKACNMSDEMVDYFTFNTAQRPLTAAMFKIIRIANKTLENIGMVRDATEEEKNDLIGSAYFVRAYAHFALCRFHGGMPYIDKALGDDDEWDLPRLGANETYRRAAEDFYQAYVYLEKAGKMRRDALPGQAGHLAGEEMDHPNGTAAMALRARCLLYAASPLNNLNGVSDWEDAAEACAQAIEVAEEWQFAMLDFSDYKTNFCGSKSTTNEQLLTYSFKSNMRSTALSGTLCYPQSNYSKGAGICPTQNFVDKYETVWGDPLNTEEDRARAVAAGHWHEQDPYTDRDPRFYNDIVYDGMVNKYCKKGINIYYDPDSKSWPATTISSKSVLFGYTWGTMDGASTGVSNTGYYCGKPWRGDWGGSAGSHYHLDPIIRMSELYLNYAEAVNEAYGPQGTAGDCPLTAVEAVDKVRARAGMPGVLDRFVASAELFRERVRNERNVELAYEGNHYYYDIRRWKTAPESMGQPLYGMYIEKTDVSGEHPKGRSYERRQIPSNRQSVWRDCMYWFPIPDDQAHTMKNFVNNEKWQ